MKLIKKLMVCVALAPVSTVSMAIDPAWFAGSISMIYVDPSDVVLKLKHNNSYVTGPCGSYYYHIRRSNDNFTEFYSLVLAAYAAQRNVSVRVTSCSGDRNILSHGNSYL